MSSRYVVVLTLRESKPSYKFVSVYTVPSKWLVSECLRFPWSRDVKGSMLAVMIRLGSTAPSPQLERDQFAFKVLGRFNTFDAAEKYVEDNLSASEPLARGPSMSVDTVKVNTTLLYSISNNLFGKALFPDNIAWTGASLNGPNTRTAFSKFENLFKWSHNMMLLYDKDITLVKNFYQIQIRRRMKNCLVADQRVACMRRRRSEAKRVPVNQ